MTPFFHVYHDPTVGDAIVTYFDVSDDEDQSIWGYRYLRDDDLLFGKPIIDVPDGIYSVDGEFISEDLK